VPQEDLASQASPRSAEAIASVKLVHQAQASSIAEFLGKKKLRDQIKSTDSTEERQPIPSYSPPCVKKHNQTTKKPSLLQRLTKKARSNKKKKNPSEPKPHSAELTELLEPEGPPLKTLQPSQQLQTVEGKVTPIQPGLSSSPPMRADLLPQQDFGLPLQKQKGYPFFSSKGIKGLPDPKRNPHSLSRRPRPKAQELREKEGKIVPAESEDIGEQ
jgi:hypothetical protein